ncbi:MAG: cytochrome c [bacterium]|nr:MAG: cytochrome c [bacterium]
MKNKLSCEEEKIKKISFLKKNGLSLVGGFVAFLFLVFSSGTVQAIPSFARQTGLSCSACHTVFPELTSFGRQFKLNGYAMTNIKTIVNKETSSNGKSSRAVLKLLNIPQISVGFNTGVTRLAKSIPGTQNNNIEFPQSLSLYYGGLIAPHFGSFIQVSMEDDEGAFGIDMLDIRYSNTTQMGKTSLLYGLTMDNGPMMGDVWNTASPWSYPYSASGIAPAPSAGTMVEGGLMGTLGAGTYGLFGNTLYLGFSVYRTAPFGTVFPPDNSSVMTIKGLSPYWRVAIQHQWTKSYLEVGTFGLSTSLYPTGVSGATDNYTDFGFDLQYEYYFAKGQFTLHSSYIAEKQEFNASYGAGDTQFLTDKINSFKTDASIFLRKGYKFTLGYFNYKGSSDNIIYAPASVSGSRMGLPNSSGLMTQVDFLPWENTKISLIYTAYNKFNGAVDNYDGSGRKSSDNNSIYLQLWFLF